MFITCTTKLDYDRKFKTIYLQYKLSFINFIIGYPSIRNSGFVTYVSKKTGLFWAYLVLFRFYFMFYNYLAC